MKRILFVLLLLPSLANAAVQLPSGKWFEEKITYHRTLTGVLVAVSEWKEVFAGGVIKKAQAEELSMYQQIHNYILTMSDIYGANRIEMIGTSNCESDWIKRPEYAITAIGDKGKAYGLWQFWEKTFDRWSKESKMPQLKYKNWQDQTRLAAWAFSKGERYKDDWVCYTKMFVEEKW